MKIRKNRDYTALMLIVIGVLVRTVCFGNIPMGLNQDEAFAAYDAWSILNYGVDSAGKSYPVYLMAWGSGMNALETYLTIPLYALFGPKEYLIRVPQLIIALISLWVVYDMCRNMNDRKLALWFLAMTAICPWHIMLSRWALESNLAPGFLLFGLYFFTKGLENKRFLPLSALMYGLALYCYATIWPIVPIMLLLQLIYCRKKLSINKYSIMSVVILAVLALPLLMFLGVNYGYMEEKYIGAITIPKLIYLRSKDITLTNIMENLRLAARMFRNQTDWIMWNSAGEYGILYKISVLPGVIGLVAAILKLKNSKNRCSLEGLMLIWLLSASLLALMVSVNVNRINIIYFPMIYFISYGLYKIVAFFGKPGKIVIVVSYMLMFAGFLNYYFGEFPTECQKSFKSGVGSAIEAINDKDGKVYIDSDVFHSQVLFYSKTPPHVFTETVEYWYYPAEYLSAKSFDRFVFDINTDQIDSEGIYITQSEIRTEKLMQAGFKTEKHGIYTLAYK